jgi:alanine racemase
MTAQTSHPTRALIHLEHLGHNVALLRELAGGQPLWPAIKANAYGHDAGIVARHLLRLGCETLCVAHAAEALELLEAGIRARFVLLSLTLPEQSEAIVEHDLEPAVCTREGIEALSRAARRAGREVAVHVMVDTGMGRIGMQPEAVGAFLEHCRKLPGLRVRGLMSHFPRADEEDKTYSLEQLERFRRVREATREQGIDCYHMANSAALFDVPGAGFDAVRPGISIYGLASSGHIANPRVSELRPVLEWKTRVTLLKEVPAGVGLSYGHSFRTRRPSLIATLPVGYGDGLSRRLSNRMEVLVGGRRCPQVGTITMDQSLVDVTALRGRVTLGDEAVLLGRQGAEAVTADELAEQLGTIVYEVVTGIARRVPREVAVSAAARPGAP